MVKRFLLAMVLFILALGIVACGRMNENNKQNQNDGDVLQQSGDINIVESDDINVIDLMEMEPTDENEFVIENGEILKFNNSSNMKYVVIPESINGEVVTKISSEVFIDNEELEGIRIPDTVVEIGEGAFSNCINLSKVILSQNLTTISSSTFSNTSITSIEIPDTVTAIGEYAFGGCKSLSEIVLSNNLTTIARSTFYNTNLEYIDIPEGIITIELSAFSTCENLKIVNISSTVENIDSIAFDDTYSLESINVADSNPNFISVDGVLFSKDKTILKKYPSNKLGDSYVIPNGVKKIDDGAFSDLQKLKVLTLNEVEKIGNVAFAESESLEEVNFGSNLSDASIKIPFLFRKTNSVKAINVADDNPIFTDVNGIVFNKDMTEILYFPHNTGMTSYEIPEGVKTIAAGAFLECRTIKEVIIPETVTLIGAIAFQECTGLESLIVPDSVKQINAEAFVNISRSVVKLPESIENVDEIFIEALQEEE